MEIIDCVIIFATNIVIKHSMNKRNVNEMNGVTLQDYYTNLSKEEKGKLLNYIAYHLGIGYSTLIAKFSGKLHFSKVEAIVINQIINEETWKK